MKFRVSPRWSLLPPNHFKYNRISPRNIGYLNLHKRIHTAPNSATNGSDGGSSSNFFVVPGATAAVIAMLGLLHARRIYYDKKVEDMKEKGLEAEFSPDAKAAFLKLLPLRSISRVWGFLMSMELPVFIRPSVYKAWAQAFHANLEEAAMPLESYSSLQDFFTRTLKEGARPIDPNPNCLVSPVDGTVLRFGQLSGPRATIEQVKGFSYPASSLLGTHSSLHEVVNEDVHEESIEQSTIEESNLSIRSRWRVSFASPKVRKPISSCPKKGVFYCVLYLNLGDYHRVHSPVDWNVFLRRHFSGRLYPVNERATRTIRNLHVENERVVLEGQWGEGFMALAAVGATNVGSIKISTEPELRTNRPKWRLQSSDAPDEKKYEPEGRGIILKKGDEVAVFNMGSTVVLIFQAPIIKSEGKGNYSSEFEFCIRNGDRVKVGEAIGRWG